MRNLLLPILATMIFIACAGEEEKTASLNLNFKAVYNGEPFLMFDELEYGDATIQITDADFFISNIVLTNDQNESVSIDKVDFVDFTNTNIVTDPSSKDRGIDVSLGNIPLGNYTKLKFGIGLDEAQNKSVPEDFSSDNVLSTNSHYWSVWNSYIFMKLQGLYTNPNTGEEDLGFVFHIGNDELYREIELPISISITEGSNTLKLEMEHQNLFDDNGSLFDIPLSPENHKPVLNGPMFMVVDNFSTAFEAK